MSTKQTNYRPSEDGVKRAAELSRRGELTSQILQEILEDEAKSLGSNLDNIPMLLNVLIAKIEPIFLDTLATNILKNGKVIDE